jgi:hypothetical protein
MQRVLGRLMGVGALFLATCSSHPAGRVPWPEGLDVAFLVRGQDGRILSVRGPILDGAATTLAVDERVDAFLVGWSNDFLQELLPRMDVARRDEIQLEAEPETCVEQGRLGDDKSTVRWPLPANSQAHRVRQQMQETESVPLDLVLSADEWAVTLPIGDAVCAMPWERRLQLFGSSPRVLSDGEIIDGAPRRYGTDSEYLDFNQVLRVDEDRVVALALRALYVFERGRPFEDTRLHRVARSEDLLGVEFLPTEDPERFRFFVHMKEGGPPSDQYSLLEITLTPEGWSDPIESEFWPGYIKRQAIADPRGFVIWTNEGIVYTASTASQINLYDAPPGIRALALKPGPLPHVIAGYDGNVYITDLLDRELPTLPIDNLSLPVPSLIKQLAWAPDGTVWAGTKGAELWRRLPGQDWAVFSSDVTTADGSCGAAGAFCGRVSIAPEARVLPQNPTLFSPEVCATLLVYLEDFDCMVPVSWPPELSDQPPEKLGRPHRSEDVVTVGGPDAILLDLPLQ